VVARKQRSSGLNLDVKEPCARQPAPKKVPLHDATKPAAIGLHVPTPNHAQVAAKAVAALLTVAVLAAAAVAAAAAIAVAATAAVVAENLAAAVAAAEIKRNCLI
jgi:hypothetical protein